MSKGENISVYLVSGSDELKVREESKALADKLAKGAGEFGLEVVDAQGENAEHIAKICANAYAAIQTMPFFGGDKVVWIKNANFLDDSMLAKTNAATEGLAQIVELLKAGLPEGVKLVVSAVNCDKRKSFYKTVEKTGQVKVFDAVDTSKKNWEGQIEDEIKRRLDKEGIEISDDAAYLLAECVGGDSLVLGKELEKLSLYAGDKKRIHIEDVRLIVSPSREQIVWDLGGAMGDRDAARAVEVLDRLLYQGQNAIGLLSGLITKMRQLLMAKEIVEMAGLRMSRNFNDFKSQLAQASEKMEGKMPEDKRYNPFSMNPYALFLSAQAAEKFSRNELIRGMDILYQAYVALVHSSANPKTVLETALIKIAGLRVKSSGNATMYRR